MGRGGDLPPTKIGLKDKSGARMIDNEGQEYTITNGLSYISHQFSSYICEVAF